MASSLDLPILEQPVQIFSTTPVTASHHPTINGESQQKSFASDLDTSANGPEILERSDSKIVISSKSAWRRSSHIGAPAIHRYGSIHLTGDVVASERKPRIIDYLFHAPFKFSSTAVLDEVAGRYRHETIQVSCRNEGWEMGEDEDEEAASGALHRLVTSVSAEKMTPGKGETTTVETILESDEESESAAGVLQQPNAPYEMKDENPGCCPIIMPNHHLVEKWDLLMALYMLYTSTVTPYDIVFVTSDDDWVLMVFNRMVDLGFVLDMLLQFNLAFKRPNGDFIKTRPAIARNYLRGWFSIDFVSIIPIDMLSQYATKDLENMQGLRIVRLLRLTKMLRLMRANRLFDRYESRMTINYSMLQLYGFLLMLFLLCHWLACGWYMMSDLEEDLDCLHINGIVDEELCCHDWFSCYKTMNPFGDYAASRKYFLALWWASGEILTVGSNIHPVTDVERSYQVVARVCAGVIYAYLIGAVCSIFTSLTRDNTAFYESMDRLNGFLVERHVPHYDFELACSLRAFYRYSEPLKLLSQKMKEILNNVSPRLQGLVAVQIHEPWLQKLSLFSSSDPSLHLPGPLYVAIASRLTATIFSPLQCLVDTYEPADSMYVIEKGVVFVRGAMKHTGETFGEDSLFAWKSGLKRGYNVNALTLGLANILKTNDLLEVIHSPQWHDETKHIRVQLTKGICREICLAILRVFSVAVEMNNFYAGVNTIRTEFVDVEARGGSLDSLLAVFRRFWREQNPNEPTEKQSRLIIDSIKRKRDIYQQRTKISARKNMNVVRNISDFFSEVGFENYSLARRLVEKEHLTFNMLMKCSTSQLHAMGMCMGDALRFVEMRDLKGLGEEYPN